MSAGEESVKKYRSALIDAAVEGWRFSRLFSRLISKLDAGEIIPRHLLSSSTLPSGFVLDSADDSEVVNT